MHLCELEVPTEPTEVPKGVEYRAVGAIAISGNMVDVKKLSGSSHSSSSSRRPKVLQISLV